MSRRYDKEDSSPNANLELNIHPDEYVSIKEIPDKYANTSPLGLLGF